MDRRKFLGCTGVAFAATLARPTDVSAGTPLGPKSTWTEFRKLFSLDPSYIHMTQMLLASHPKPVRDAIDRHRRKLDENPTDYWENNFIAFERRVAETAAKYLEADAEEIMLTDSTTMGLGLLYSGLRIGEGDEILTTTHDHYSTEKSLEYATRRNGAKLIRIPLYADPAKATADEIVSNIVKAVTPSTRVIAVTWVHSVTGVKIPIAEIGRAVADLNAKRDQQTRIYYCIDGVHGFGVDDISMKQVNCDFFVAGTHKWIFGPRGTGVVFGRRSAWDILNPTIPAFSDLSYGMWMGALPEGKIHFFDLQTPGGFHSFEHRWALAEAFEIHMSIGKARIMERNRQLSTRVKEGLLDIAHVRLHTPQDPALSASINCFEVEGMKPDDVMKKLHQKKIITSVTPYRIHYNRLTPAILNTEDEVDTCLAAIRDIRKT